MRALVTGGAGFIGSHVCATLAQRGYEVVAVDDLTTGKPENLRDLSLQLVITSSTSPRIRELFSRGKFDLVVHLAARNIISSSTDPWGDFDTNVRETFGILELAQKSGAKVICASSCSVYGQADELPTKEDAPFRPVSFYAAGKICGETYCETFRQLYGMDITIVRYSNVYGPKQRIGVVPSMIKASLTNKNITITGSGNHVRDYTYIDDAVEATMKLIDVRNGVYNIATGNGWTTDHLAEQISLLCRVPQSVDYIPGRPIDNIEKRILDCSALRAIGYSCETSLLEGLERTIDWWRNEISVAY